VLLRFAPGLFLALFSCDDAERGLAGERVAARALARAGLATRGRRVATVEAEIDLLCHDGECLVLVEVKTGRAGERWRPLDRVDRERERRLEQAARALARRTRNPTRVDYVEVLTAQPGSLPRVVHYRGCETRS
jgi:putative endonuclease